MPTLAIPITLQYIASVARMPDGSAVDYAKFTVTEPIPFLSLEHAKNHALFIHPLPTSGYYGAIRVLYNKFNWDSYDRVLVDEDAYLGTVGKPELIQQVAELLDAQLGAPLETSEVSADDLVFDLDAFGNTRTKLHASPTAYLFEGGYAITFVPWRPVASRLHALLHTVMAAPNYLTPPNL